MDSQLTDHFAAFAQALAQPGAPGRDAFAALHRLTDHVLGAKIFTVLALDYDAGVMRRLYSSQQDLYPEGGADPIGDTVWEQTIIGQKKPLVFAGYAEMKELLPEHEALKALGCGAMLNLPVVYDGKSIGTINILHEDGRYSPERLKNAPLLIAPAAALLLAVRAE